MPLIRISAGTLRAHLHERARAFRLPGVLADGHQLVELQAVFLERLEHGVGRHQLGEARGLHALIGVALAEHAAAVEVAAGCTRGRRWRARFGIGTAARLQR